ncbi:MAG: CBS domain-containing protein [Methyloprofundus sp.]|nr:CBS domain-containing protein [Methyloprofundus sp.]MDT8425469.1 CBS domain-containing protein [Methyloprofundus sp.]
MLAKITVADYMTKHLVKLTKNMNVVDAVKIILEHKITGAPVMDEHNKLVGMFSEKDALKMVVETAYNQSSAGRVSEFMTEEVVQVAADMSVVDLAAQFQNSAVRSFPVYQNKELVGIISRTDVLRAMVNNA